MPISAGDLIAGMVNDPALIKRATGWPGFDWVFDGGLPMFGAIMICASSGTGKSTLLWHLLCLLAQHKVDDLYISAEQTLRDLGRQFSRFGPAPSKHMIVHAETDRDSILSTIEKLRPRVVVIDSIHAVEGITDSEGFALATGGVTAVSQLGRDIKRLASELEILIFAVGHMNNDGTVAGGANVRHMLDATLVMRRGINDRDPKRVLEFDGKSRFGPIGRQALFEMREDGLIDKGPLTHPERDVYE